MESKMNEIGIELIKAEQMKDCVPSEIGIFTIKTANQAIREAKESQSMQSRSLQV